VLSKGEIDAMIRASYPILAARTTPPAYLKLLDMRELLHGVCENTQQLLLLARRAFFRWSRGIAKKSHSKASRQSAKIRQKPTVARSVE